jgi:hypothetical protein
MGRPLRRSAQWLGSIWNRHLRQYSFSGSVTAQQKQFCYTEARSDDPVNSLVSLDLDGNS